MPGSLCVCVCVPFGSNSASMIQESAWTEHSGGRRCFSASASTAIMRNWILKNWLSLETKDGYVHLFHPTLTTPSVSASPYGTWPKSLPFPEASALYFFFFFPLLLQALSCFSYFFHPGFKASHSALLHCLLFILARRLAQALRKALTNSHSPFPPLCSVSTHCPYSCLSCTASIARDLANWTTLVTK